MKKILLSLLILSFSFSVQALSSGAQALKDKLAVFEYINATFVQRVTSSEGKLLNESTGELTISRPGKFHWQVLTPEEELIVSDGKTIWYYTPFIEQVTLINFSDAINGTPFTLLAGATNEQWQDYVVEQKGDHFIVTNPQQQQATTFTFEFDKNNKVRKFVVIEELGQQSEFILTYKKNSKAVNPSLFNFEIPNGVEVDDQR
ncbi:outer membrane lipoprotein chaperone LolA [Psychromonas hadalis]|uniref:outer membrane lipoprotein chaperone LolA n=1 Tax=Psychromonas hadalis TaxID=211669 RepID=UPI0003B51D3B|nr:outer membrane lipoprotein chaperone LolA [Psychromonas hadalis]